MSTYIRIFCTLNDPVTPKDIHAFIVKEKHFRAPELELPGSEAADSPHWGQLRIVYNPAKRPLIVTRNVGDKLFQQERAEAKADIGTVRDQDARENLTEWLEQAEQVITVEIDEVGATEACWKAADSIEMHLAQFLEGFIYVPGEGIYDPELELIASL